MRSSNNKSWWALVGIGAFASMVLWAGDYRLEEYVGAPGNPCQAARGMPDNTPEAVTAEINHRAIRKLLARAVGVTDLQDTERVQLTVSGDGRSHPAESPPVYLLSHYTLNYPTLEARELFTERFREEIKNYLRIRLTGHTRAFAEASYSRPKKKAPSQPRSIDVVLNAFKEVPESWLKLWQGGEKTVGYYLLDGELAWTFRSMDQFPWHQVVDAQEFDPKLKDVFADARKKAETNLQARGVVPKPGYCHAYWVELKKVLQKDYKMRWWCPTDLNEGLYD